MRMGLLFNYVPTFFHYRRMYYPSPRHFQVGGRGEAGECLENGGEIGSRLEANALPDSLNGEVSVFLLVVHSTASLLDAVFIEEGVEVAAFLLVDDLRHVVGISLCQSCQLIDGESVFEYPIVILHDGIEIAQQLLLGLLVHRTALVFLLFLRFRL